VETIGKCFFCYLLGNAYIRSSCRCSLDLRTLQRPASTQTVFCIPDPLLAMPCNINYESHC
jgi:hypothetical protein